MPPLPTTTQKSESIAISSAGQHDAQEDLYTLGGKWEDEEERRFFEDIQDLRDFVPKSLLGIDEKGAEDEPDKTDEELRNEKERREKEETEVLELEKELKRLELEEANQNGDAITTNGNVGDESQVKDDE